jgi:GNAT superfamily N-acetyltransferase
MTQPRRLTATPASAAEILPLRARHREEMSCQIVHDSIHRREGWTLSYLLRVDGAAVGFASAAIAGPWKDRPTFFELYVLPEHRSRAFDLFEAFLDASGARFFEVQTNDALVTATALRHGRDIASEKIIFQDGATTALPSNGAVLRHVTSEDEARASMAQRQGSSEWRLELDGAVAATGGIAFHYNVPYADLYMDVAEPFRRRGLGSYLVQELKRACHEIGSVPCARCSPANVASLRTLQKAGFVPCAHILIGAIVRE